MSALQQRLYSMITQRNRLSLQTSETDGAPRKTVALRRLNNTVMQLRKICNHPFVFEEVERQINPGQLIMKIFSVSLVNLNFSSVFCQSSKNWSSCPHLLPNDPNYDNFRRFLC